MIRALSALFQDYRTLRGVIDAVLEGKLGTVTADDVEAPRVARLDLGCYAVLGGDEAHALAAELISAVRAPREILVPDRQGWRDLLHEIHGERLSDRPMRTFVSHALDATHLRELSAGVAEAHELVPLNASLAGQLDEELTPHALQVFPSAEALASEGIGFGVVNKGRLVSAASSYAVSSRRVEVAVATRPSHRRRGLARAAAARMLLSCLEAGLVPEWSASNPVSKRLALSLGYRPGAMCDVFYLE